MGMIQSVIRSKEFFTKCERTISRWNLEDLITPSPKGRRTILIHFVETRCDCAEKLTNDRFLEFINFHIVSFFLTTKLFYCYIVKAITLMENLYYKLYIIYY